MTDARQSSPLDPGRVPIRRALISVYDKAGLVDLGQALAASGVEIVSTGGSFRALVDAGVPVTEVSWLTGFAECLDGRVKTLHPRVHAGILADRRLQTHRDQLSALGIEPFDLVVSNLYPVAATVASGATPDECVEQIDIGGPALLRAAAKNFQDVTVIVDPADYPQVLQELGEKGQTSLKTRFCLARKVFALTSAYDAAISQWLEDVDPEGHPYFTEPADA